MRNTVIESHNGQLMSKTQHYRKVTKPLLERKRRARMNHYLDELKNLIVETMEAQGEHITKLEKADILEMTVTYLKSKSQSNFSNHNNINNDNNNCNIIINQNNSINPEKFRAGYTQAAYEVSKVFASVPGLDVDFGTKLMKHLGYKLKDLQPPSVLQQQQQQRQQEISSTSLTYQTSRSPSPNSSLLNNNLNHQFTDKPNNLLLKEKHNFDDIKYNNKMLIVVTPPQSPNSSYIRPSVLSLKRNENDNSIIWKNCKENIHQHNKHNIIEEEDEIQQHSVDVWRPW